MLRLLLAFPLLLASNTVARADSANNVAAEALFDEGRQLMEQADYRAACPKFEASQRLDPGVGTMLNLANCYEKLGKTASAWAEYREASAAARAAGNGQREQLARERADALEPRLSRLTITTWKGQDVQVARDGKPMDAAEFGIAIPVDPGSHHVTARAEGKREWSTSITIKPDGDRVQVTVPILPDESQQSADRTYPRQASAAGSARGDRRSSSGLGVQRTVALAVGGLGVAGLVVGSVYGLTAKSQWDRALDTCDSPNDCTPRGVALGEDAKVSATLSTVGFAVGLAGLATGAVLWFTADEESPGEVQVALLPGAVAVHAAF